MNWFLGTFTAPFNRRHKVSGHLFSGRHQALVVVGNGNGHLRTGCDEVHLNPGRAKTLRPAEPLRACPWSSWPEYLKPPGQRPAWLRMDRLLGGISSYARQRGGTAATGSLPGAAARGGRGLGIRSGSPGLVFRDGGLETRTAGAGGGANGGVPLRGGGAGSGGGESGTDRDGGTEAAPVERDGTGGAAPRSLPPPDASKTPPPCASPPSGPPDSASRETSRSAESKRKRSALSAAHSAARASTPAPNPATLPVDPGSCPRYTIRP